MKYEIILMARGETPWDLTTTVLAASDEWKDIEALKDRLAEPGGASTPAFHRPPAPAKPGRPGRQVVVTGIAEGEKTPLVLHQTFESALEASVALGYNFNMVNQAFSTAKARGENRITLRGIELAHTDEYVRD